MKKPNMKSFQDAVDLYCKQETVDAGKALMHIMALCANHIMDDKERAAFKEIVADVWYPEIVESIA